MSKPKLKWFREGHDPHEDLYLIPVGKERTADDDLNTDAAVAWIKIAYDRTRFYSGRGGEGISRPDSYVAYVQDTRPDRQHRGIVITMGTNTVAHIGGLFSDRSDRSFTSLRVAKQAIGQVDAFRRLALETKATRLLREALVEISAELEKLETSAQSQQLTRPA